MSLTLFIAVLSASFVIVRIGAIAFQLTGLEWSLAKFQALSCFSGTGFTTKESELITSNPQRRKIATVLIILGNAGIVTLIGTFANALGTEKSMWKSMSENLLPFPIPELLVPWINLITILIPAYLLFKLFTNRHFLRKLTNFLRKKVMHTKLINSVTIEELVVITGGYGVARIEVSSNSSVKGKKLSESGLREKDITVLAISRGKETISNPHADTEILVGDELISYGDLENLRDFK
jgi:hypothetical protein